MNLKKRYIPLILVVAFVVGILGAYTGLKLLGPKMTATETIDIPFTQKKSDDSLKGQMETIKQAYELIDEHYVEDVEDGQLLEGAIQGMLETLNDPYSSYMSGEMMNEFNEQITSSFQGIGAEVSMVDGKVTVVSPIKGSPAEKGGVRTNDQILKVDDQALDGMDLNEAVEQIRGEKGSEVVLTVQRKGAKKPFEITLVRDDIPIETVHSDMQDIQGKKTGVIEVSNFSETTSKEFAEELEKLEQEGMEGLVIDVRGNPGGLLDSVEEILSQFVPKDIPYVQIEDREGKKDKYHSTLEEKKSYPINVVIDEGSASASEILAVALKEVGYDTVGQTSFGKGTVQQAVPLNKEDGSTIKLTFFKWLSPEGNWINEKGVTPTVEQKQPEFYYTNPISVDKAFKLDQTEDEIENVQMMLKGIGYDPKRYDGYFDEATEKAVKDFQKQKELKVTGEVDEQTAAAIETEVIEVIRSGKQDLQLEKALDVLYD